MTETADEFIARLYSSIDWLSFRNRFNADLYSAYSQSNGQLRKGDEPNIDDDFLVQHIKGMQALGDRYVTDVLDASPGIARKLASRPRCAILPTGDLNAWAACSGDGDPVCILDISLVGCLSVLSAGVAYGILAYRQVSEEDRIDSVKHLVLIEALLFLGLRGRLQADIYKEHIYTIPRLHSNEHISHLATAITTHLLCFVVAHEVAHHALGHLSQASAVPIGPGSSDLRIYTRTQKQEFEADLLGCQLLLAFLDKTEATARDAPALAFVPLLFFHFLSVIDEVHEVFTGALAPSVTHPPAHRRRRRLKRYLSEGPLTRWQELYVRVEEVFSSINGTDVGDLIQ
jgi:hypothetical protein